MFMRLAQFGIALSLLAGLNAGAQTDARWMKAYVARCSGKQGPCPAAASQIEGDARFQPLLRIAFPQTEYWWATLRHPSARVSATVQDFLGIPGDVVFKDDRYVTIPGCVPHDCTDGGMLWVDTLSHPPLLLFAAMNDAHSVEGKSLIHIEIYASKPLNFENLPPAFLASLQHWWAPYTTRQYFPSQVALATLVQPNGFSTDLTWDSVFFQQNFPGNKKTGVSQQ